MNFEIVFATRNKNKIKEVREILSPYGITLYGLDDLNIKIDEPKEGESSYFDNALIKANSIKDIVKFPIISDDSGLEIEALDNKPGVNSARFAASFGGHENAMKEILKRLESVANRNARFVCDIVLINLDNKPLLFEGVVNGKIDTKLSGDKGFGYDPIFVPDESEFSYASLKNKNAISHRARALRKLITYLRVNNYIK